MQTAGRLWDHAVSTPKHETKNSLEVGVFRPVDDRVDGAVEDDNHSKPWDDWFAWWYQKSGCIGCKTRDEATHHVEEILGDLHLPLVEARLPLELSGAAGGGYSRNVGHFNPLPHHLLRVAGDVSVDLDVTHEQDNQWDGVNEGRPQQTKEFAIHVCAVY